MALGPILSRSGMEHTQSGAYSGTSVRRRSNQAPPDYQAHQEHAGQKSLSQTHTTTPSCSDYPSYSAELFHNLPTHAASMDFTRGRARHRWQDLFIEPRQAISVN
jgi:hypothetical protein